MRCAPGTAWWRCRRRCARGTSRRRTATTRAPGDGSALDEGTDTYDTIEWLLKNVPRNNGRVGMLGVSYLGWTWDTWGGCMVLVTDYTGTPAGIYGQAYKAHLLATPH